jgi:transposase
MDLIKIYGPLLPEIRDLLREIRDALVDASPERMRALGPAQGKNNLAPQKQMPHLEQIAAWRRLGMPQKKMRALLADQGVTASHSALSRFIRGFVMQDRPR